MGAPWAAPGTPKLQGLICVKGVDFMRTGTLCVCSKPLPSVQEGSRYLETEASASQSTPVGLEPKGSRGEAGGKPHCLLPMAVPGEGGLPLYQATGTSLQEKGEGWQLFGPRDQNESRGRAAAVPGAMVL